MKMVMELVMWSWRIGVKGDNDNSNDNSNFTIIRCNKNADNIGESNHSFDIGSDNIDNKGNKDETTWEIILIINDIHQNTTNIKYENNDRVTTNSISTAIITTNSKTGYVMITIILIEHSNN